MVQYTNYSYYDTPDGEDFGKKLYYLSRISVTIGSYMAVTDCLAVSKPVGFVPMVDRFIRVFSRPLIGTFVFESTVYIATKLRKKDDGFNHVFGCVAAFAYAQKIINNPLITWGTCAPICLILYCLKDQKVNYGFEFFVDYYNIREETCNSLYSRYNDWTWRRKTPRPWLRADEVEAANVKN